MTSKRLWGAASLGLCVALSFAPGAARAAMPVQLQAARPQSEMVVKAHSCACRHHHHHHHHRHYGHYYGDPYSGGPYYWSGPLWTRYWDMRFM